MYVARSWTARVVRVASAQRGRPQGPHCPLYQRSLSRFFETLSRKRHGSLCRLRQKLFGPEHASVELAPKQLDSDDLDRMDDFFSMGMDVVSPSPSDAKGTFHLRLKPDRPTPREKPLAKPSDIMEITDMPP